VTADRAFVYWSAHDTLRHFRSDDCAERSDDFDFLIAVLLSARRSVGAPSPPGKATGADDFAPCRATLRPLHNTGACFPPELSARRNLEMIDVGAYSKAVRKSHSRIRSTKMFCAVLCRENVRCESLIPLECVVDNAIQFAPPRRDRAEGFSMMTRAQLLPSRDQSGGLRFFTIVSNWSGPAAK